MNRTVFLVVTALVSTGCHRVCGGAYAPIWVMAECHIEEPYEVPVDPPLDTSDTGAPLDESTRD